MLINEKLNYTAQKIMWAEAVHTCKRVRNSMATTGSTKIPFEIFYGEKPKIIGSFLEFGRIAYVTKWGKPKKNMIKKMYKAIMVVCIDNHERYTYKLYNPDTKKVIMTRDVKWADCKMTDPAETLKMFRDAYKEYMVPGIEEDMIPTLEPEFKMPVNVTPYKVESVMLNENL